MKSKGEGSFLQGGFDGDWNNFEVLPNVGNSLGGSMPAFILLNTFELGGTVSCI
jgi:hypothetical protein